MGMFNEFRGVDFSVSRKAQRRINLDSLKENILYFMFSLKTEYLLLRNLPHLMAVGTKTLLSASIRL